LQSLVVTALNPASQD